MRRQNNLLITDALEIDLYEHLKRDPFRFNGQIRVYLPAPLYGTVFLPLASTRQRYGRRIWFLCGCNRRTSKLYIFMGHMGCRHCLRLKYASQYRVGNTVDWRSMNELKQKRLQRQQRRLWYDLKPTQFGRQFYKLREENEKISKEMFTGVMGRI